MIKHVEVKYESIVPYYTVLCCACGKDAFDGDCTYPEASMAIVEATQRYDSVFGGGDFAEWSPGLYICPDCDPRTRCYDCGEVISGEPIVDEDGDKFCQGCARSDINGRA